VSAKKDGGSPSTSSTSFADMTGLTVAITPSLATSKLLCIMSVNGCSAAAADGDAFSMQILADSTNVTRIENSLYTTGTSAVNSNICLVGVIHMDTTSEVTVKGRFHNRQANNIVFNATTNDESDLVVLELLA